MTPITTWHWLAFGVFVTTLLAVDLGVFHRRPHDPTLREAAAWTGVWCGLALCFNLLVWAWQGSDAAWEFLAGYLVEWSLSMDNVFVFAVIFTYFGVPTKYQYRILFWGIIGAIAMRLSFILIGKGLIDMFDWVMLVMGVVVFASGAKLAFHDPEPHPDKNLLLRVARRLLPVAHDDGNRFFIRKNGRLYVTPLFLVLLVVESTDVVFAVDSVPAIFGVVNQSAPYFVFVVFTSNVFAILGLRALYFLLAGMLDMFRYLNLGLSTILMFIGVKMWIDYWVPTDHGHFIPSWVSLMVVVGTLSAAITASIVADRPQKSARTGDEGSADEADEGNPPPGPDASSTKGDVRHDR